MIDSDSSEHTLDASLAGDPGTTHPNGFPVTRWTRYEFLAVLGHGGMGSVYRARDRQLGRDVALKFIRGGDPDLTLRLLREARAQARVDHPNICKVYEVGEVDGKAYIAMELVSGRSLRDAAADMSLLDRVLAVRDAAFALHEAHKLGILHRDIKPTNIMIESDDTGRRRPVVMDFGIAHDQSAEHHTQTGALLGTPAYMSPEQARGRRDLDRRADVYSLGATLYDLLAGVPPFRADTPMQVVLQVLTDDPVPLRTHAPTVPDDLATITSKCLDKDPARRYDSARALAEDLDRYIRGDPILGRKVSTFQRLLRRARKHRLLVAVTLVAFVAVLVAAAYGLSTRIAARELAAALAAEAELGRELAQDAKEIEWLLRTAHLLPLHDTTPERALVRARMDAVAARTVPPGISGALVDYTLGRGHYALGEIIKAHDHLTRALTGGLDTPELHYALGLTLGERYARLTEEARMTERGERLEQRLAALEQEYLAPAFASMERARTANIEAPSYLEGMISLYRRDYDQAIVQARRAREEAPWFYEAHKLEALAHSARADQLAKETDDMDGARRAYETAAQLFDTAAGVARSDASVYEGGAAAWTELLKLDAGRDGAPETHLPHIRELCEAAAAARPDSTQPFDLLARAHIEYGKRLHFKGEAPGPAAAPMLTAAERALAIDPADFNGLFWRIQARISEANYALMMGTDPGTTIDDSSRDAERLLALYPDNPRALRVYTDVRLMRASYDVERGVDPTPDVMEVVELQWAAAAQRNDFRHLENVLWGQGILATWLVSHGQDPGPALARSEEAVARCIELLPRGYNCPKRLSLLLAWQARYALMTGGDPRPFLALAHERLDAAELLVNATEWNTRIELHRIEGTYLLRRDEDPSASLAAAASIFEDCTRRGPPKMCDFMEALRLLLVAEHEAKRGGSVHESLERAKALTATEEDWGSRATHAEADLRLATLATSRAERSRRIADGLAAAARGLAVNTDEPRLLALQASLHLLAAETDPANRDETLRLARASMSRARALHPWIHTEFAATVAALERTSD